MRRRTVGMFYRRERKSDLTIIEERERENTALTDVSLENKMNF